MFLTFHPNPRRARLRTSSSQPSSIPSLLQYHNVIRGLHRVFIQLSRNPLVPKFTPKADDHAATSLNYVLTMIRIAYRIMATQGILHGHSELHHYLWNAVITINGFMLAYSYSLRCLRAREHMLIFRSNFATATPRKSSTWHDAFHCWKWWQCKTWPKHRLDGSWTDMINLDAWPSYRNEFGEALIGLTGIFALHNLSRNQG